MTLNKEILKGLIESGDRVVVGVSGGADSMCLIDLLIKYRKSVNFNVLAVHINHNIREDAQKDEDFVRNFCLKNKVDFKSVHINTKEYAKKNGKTIEQAGRELRYSIFNNLLIEYNASKLLIAHHKVDQAETVLMHIARGSSIKGARGLGLIRGNIIRPLLNFTRQDVETYNKENNVEFVNDCTNSDIKYTRNYVRNEILPRLEKIYPNIVNSLCLFADKCARDDNFIESILPLDLIAIHENIADISLKIAEIEYALSSRLIRRVFEGLKASVDMEEKHIKDVLSLVKSKNGSKIDLPNNLKVFKEYDKLVVIKGTFTKSAEEKAFELGITKFENFGDIEATVLDKNDFCKFDKGVHIIDMDKIPNGAIWRTKKDGDVFSKFGSGTKKLADYLTDKKIPKRIRENIPLLAKGNKILVVAGQDISNDLKIDENTTKIAKLTYYTNIK